MNISRYLNKTIEIVQKFLRLVSEIMPNLNKATKKGDEELKKKCIVLQKAFNTGYKELLDYSLKNLSIIQDYLQEMQDLSVEGKWGKNIKEIIKANKNISEELSLINGKVFMLETQEKNMISMLLSECKLFSMFNISNVKELSKALKSVKF